MHVWQAAMLGMQEHVLVDKKHWGRSAHWLLGRSCTLSSLLRAMAAAAAGPAHALPAAACHTTLHAQPLRSIQEHAGGSSRLLSSKVHNVLHACLMCAMPYLGMGALSHRVRCGRRRRGGRSRHVHTAAYAWCTLSEHLHHACKQRKGTVHRYFKVLVRARRA